MKKHILRATMMTCTSGTHCHRDDRLAGILIGLAVLLVYLLSSGGDFFITDGEVEFLSIQALVDGRTLSIPAYAHFPQLKLGRYGQQYSQYGFGMTLVGLPFYLFGIMLAHLIPGSNRYLLTRLTVSTLPAVCAALAVTAFFFISRAYHSRGRSVCLALILGLATILWPYSRVLFPEALLSACITWAVFLAIYASEASGGLTAVISGSLLGLAFMTRPSAITYLPGTLWLMLQRRDRRSRGRVLIILGLCFMVFLLAQLAINFLKFGNPFYFGYSNPEERFGKSTLTGIYGLLLSSGRSVFLYSPLTLLALGGWPHFIRRFRSDAIGFILLSTMPTLFFSTWSVWYGGWAWGNRYLVPIVPFLLLPLPFLWNRVGTILCSVLLAFTGCGINFLGVAVDTNEYYSFVISQIGELYEQAILFIPQYSPVVGHLRFLLAGRTIPWAVLHLSQHGLPVDIPWLIYVLMLLLGIALVSLAIICARAVRPEV